MPERLPPNSSTPWQEQLQAGIAALQQRYPQAMVEQLQAYLQLLARWNQTYNLTAIRDLPSMVDRHLLDSLAVAPYVGSSPFLDLGSGAGLPGVPLAIIDPARPAFLLEANGKKARFLRTVKRELGLSNAQVIEKRAEQAFPELQVPTIIARAVAPIGVLARLAETGLTENGRLLAMKGPQYQEELAELPGHWALQTVHALHLPGLPQRYLLVLGR